MKINMIMSTGREDLVHLIISDKTKKLIYSIIWDIVNNIEYSHQQVKYKK
jgi:hypothetical protein